jgi:endo-1,4-beta-xylanase
MWLSIKYYGKSNLNKTIGFNMNKFISLYLYFFLLTISSMSFAQEELKVKDVFKNDFLIGAAINEAQINGRDSVGIEILKTQFNSISPENVLKWSSIQPKPDTNNFEPADKYVEFGEKNNMFIIGHTLVWHSQVPRWVFNDENGNQLNRDELLKRMKEHIFTVVGRYKGKIKGWDVVNEALNEDGTLRETLWKKIIGDDYIEKAFEFAHEADPDAELYYNDYSLVNKPKRDGAVKLIRKLLKEGINIDGIGMQGHYNLAWPTTAQIDSSIKAFSALGVKVMFTELDINILPSPQQNNTAEVSLNFKFDKKLNPYPDGLPDSVQNVLAQRYSDIFKVFINNKSSISRVTFWGVRDSDSWLNNWPIRGRTNYPLLFNRDGRPKEAFYRIINLTSKN